MTIAPTLIKGSDPIASFSTLTCVKPLFAKGFTGITAPTLVVTALQGMSLLRFRIDETLNETLSAPIVDSILTLPVAQDQTLTVYSRSGALFAFKIDIADASYISLIADATAASDGIATASEGIAVINTTNVAAFVYNNTVNRQSGISLYDSSYMLPLNKRPLLDANIQGVIMFLSTGFTLGKTWLWQKKDASGHIYLAIATNFATAPADSEFGTPVMIAKNIGTVGSPTYDYPDLAYTSLPSFKFAYYANFYYTTSATPSPFPYLLMKSKDSLSTMAFTVDVNRVSLAQNYTGKSEIVFDFGVPYLGLFKSAGSLGVTGLGGAVSTEVLAGSMMVMPFKNITGVRVIGTGGLTSTDVKIKQLSITTENSVVLHSDRSIYPVLDDRNRIYLSISEANALNNAGLYGTAVDVTESGTYILRSQLGGYVTITTNRLLYNPYYSSYDQFSFNHIDSDIFPSVTPATVLTGATQYRCFYLKNRHPTKTFSKITLWSDLNCNQLTSSTSNTQYLKFALLDSGTRSGDGSDNVMVWSGSSTPSWVLSGGALEELADIVAYSLRSNLILGFQFDGIETIYAPPPAVLKSSVDLRQYVETMADQGAMNSCTANAITSACELILKANDQFVELSRRFNYYESRDAEPGDLPADRGAFLQLALAGAKQVGLPLETTWPYVVEGYNEQPSAAAYTEAALRKIDAYDFIDADAGSALQINHIKAALCEGYPVIIGFWLTAEFQLVSGTFVYQLENPYTGVDPGNPQIGAHAVVVVGYSDEYAAFILENSWGSTWGDGGYGLFPYATMTDATEAWVVRGFDGMKVPVTIDVPPPPEGTVAPTGVTFAFADSESSAIVVNNLLPGQAVPVWVQRVINPSGTVVKEDILSTLRMKVAY